MIQLRERLRRHIPTREQIHNSRWLRWATPHLHHSRLWLWSRRGVAMGVALGIFFGLLIPMAQIPLSAGAAIALRANLPAAMASTLITNPVTFAPIYYLAHQTGAFLLRDADKQVTDPETLMEELKAEEADGFLDGIMALGKPLLLGLAIFATLGGLLAYLVIHVGWRLWVLQKRRMRRLRSLNAPPP